MDTKNDRQAVLLAIRPKYATSILAGSKSVEFRRQCFSSDVAHIVLYATSPVKAIVGITQVDTIITDSIPKLWKQFNGNSGVSHTEFIEYYKDSSLGHAICLIHPIRLRKPLSLKTISNKLNAPQSFRYLSEKQFSLIERYIYE